MTAKIKTTKDTIVLDTSVILYNADSVFKFRGKDIVIPLVVLYEIDKFRSLDDEKGRNARKFIRSMNELRKKGDLSCGVPLFEEAHLGDISIQFTTDTNLLSEFPLDMSSNDDKILSVCLKLTKKDSKNAILVTKDISLTVKANLLGIGCLDYSDDQLIEDSSELYSGTAEVVVDSGSIDIMHSGGTLFLEDVDIYDCPPLHDNMGVTLMSSSNLAHTALAIYKDGQFKKLRYADKTVLNVSPRNREQAFALELLLDPEVRLVTLTGMAGTGKTLIAIAAALHQVYDQKTYKRLVISRPIQPLGKDLGYLPGDMYEKMDPWVGPVRDAMEFVFNGDSSKFDELRFLGVFDIEPLTYIRGRSLPQTLFILDEAQNLTRHEMKTIISRIGTDSKIILTGDVFQIDNHYLDTTNNGLTVVIEKFKEIGLAGHISFVKGQRSKLAYLAAEIL